MLSNKKKMSIKMNRIEPLVRYKTKKILEFITAIAIAIVIAIQFQLTLIVIKGVLFRV